MLFTTVHLEQKKNRREVTCLVSVRMAEETKERHLRNISIEN